MIRLEQIKTDPDAPDFAKPHPRQECIWNSQYPTEEFSASLTDYPAHGAQVQAWKDGIHLARKLAVEVGMGPENNREGNGETDDEDDGGGAGCPDSADDNDDDSASWFYKPFKYAGNWMLSVDDEGVEDEDEADLMSTDETDIGTPETRFSEDARFLCEDAALAQTAMSTFNKNLLNADVNAEGLSKSPSSSTVTVPGRNQTIYKSTLVAQLPSLSHDRLTRVRQRQEYQTIEEAVPTNASVVSLFDDYAVLDRSNSGYLVGNLVRLTHKGTRGSQDYKRPVSYDDDRGKDITAFLQIYPKSDVPELKFSLHSTLQSVPFQDILCHVNLRATEDGMDIVELSADEHSALLTAVGRLLSSSRRTRRQRAAGPTTSAENVGAVNRTVVRPPEHAGEGQSELRRSSRV